MANKFGKFLLFTAAVSTAAAAAYYFTQKKELTNSCDPDDYDDDYDNFYEDLDEKKDPSRNYVTLSREGQAPSEDTFTPLSERISQTQEYPVEETVEEFFDEEDGDDTEPPLSEEQ